MNTILKCHSEIEGYAELTACYRERAAELQALNRAINDAAHTPIFPFDLALLTDLFKTIKKLGRDFPDTKAFLENPHPSLWNMSIDFDLALPGHSRLKAIYDLENTLANDLERMTFEKDALESGAYHESLTQADLAAKLETLRHTIMAKEAEHTQLITTLSELENAYPLAAMALSGERELATFDQHFDLILSGYSELKTAYATQVVLLHQYNDARKAVVNHRAFNFNLHRLGELDQEIERLETQYPQAVAYHKKRMAEERLKVLDLDPDPEPPVYFPLDADYLFTIEGVTS